MNPHARNLTDNERQQILEAVQLQLGWAEYQRLVDALGEDGVIESVVQQFAAAAPPVRYPTAGLERGPRRFRKLSAEEVRTAFLEATVYTFAAPLYMFGTGEVGVTGGILVCIIGWIYLIAFTNGQVLLWALALWPAVFVWCLIATFCTKR